MSNNSELSLLEEKLEVLKDLEKDFYFSGKGFLFDGTTGLTYTLNTTGGFIFGKLQKKSNLTEILKMMVEEYEVKETRAEKDLRDFIRQLNELKIIKLQ